MSVVGDLMSVHNSSWDFDRAHEIEEVVAQAVSELLDICLVHLGVV